MSKFSYPLIGFVIILFFFFPSCHKKNPSEPSQSNMWVAINHGLNNLQIRDIAIDPSNSKIIYVGTPEGVFRTDDAGKNWKLKNNGLTYRDITDLEIISNEFAIILSATWGGGVFISENAGESWTAMNNGLADPRVSVIIDATDIIPMFYEGTETGLFN
ncbi:MAG: hypothetical protein ONB13_05980 [candidate division KSB1 bacterium]|nr:hypothetical protein [candidate division KSB1 bacterium]